MRPAVEGYWLQAQGDLAHAAADLRHGFYDGCVTESFLAAELALKAVLLELTGVAPPHLHNLTTLETLLRSQGTALPSEVSVAVAGLPVSFWIQSRSPDPDEGFVPVRDVSEQDAPASLGHVIVTWTRQHLEPPPPTSTNTRSQPSSLPWSGSSLARASCASGHGSVEKAHALAER